MKYLNLFLGLLFLVFAAVQYNDPDPWSWMAIYLLVAWVCIFAAFGKYHRYVLWGILAINTVWMLLCLPDFMEWIKMGSPDIASEMKATTPYIENTREFLGLFICWVVLLWHTLQERKLRSEESVTTG